MAFSSLPKLRTSWKVNNLRCRCNQISCNAVNFADAPNRIQEVLPTVEGCIMVKGASKEGD
jgi:hypothetical protein